MKIIELLSPARTAEIGIEAFNHGADAVYIGAPKFGARAAAGNSISEIERLAQYGHQYGGRTFVAFNTLVKDEELEEAERMAWQLYEAGADALIVQDLGLLKLDLPPIELHASTQTDNRTAEKVRLMRDLGMTRVVLARELDIAQIKVIREAVPDVELECFVHGALCVGVSGQCYLSEALMGRSANRGVCGQPCRLPMDLINAQGETVVANKHLLCLKDMNRATRLEKLIEAGVCSLKIEGRLKDMSYVKNVTAYYRREIDQLMERHLKWHHVSDGDVKLNFEPKLTRSFNRNFSTYMHDRAAYWNFESPKSVGETIGRVFSVEKNCFKVSGLPIFNGDGLMIGNVGVRANKTIQHHGLTEVFPLYKDCLYLIKPKDYVCRNYDIEFERLLSKKSAERKVGVDIVFRINHDHAEIELSDRSSTVLVRRGPFEVTEKMRGEDYYANGVCALGNTIFYPLSFKYDTVPNDEDVKPLFIPVGMLNEMRREAVALLMEKRAEREEQRRKTFVRPDYSENAQQLDARGIIPTDFRANAMNRLAKEILADMKLEDVADAFEKKQDASRPVMLTRHCLKFALGQCPHMNDKGFNKHHEVEEMEKSETLREKWIEPMSLRIGKRKFHVKFCCDKDCYSEIYL